jgi:DNA-binding transcriptional MerR regulator
MVNDQNGQAPFSDLTRRLQAKPFYKIGEVAKLLDVKPHVLRYWESEFPTLKPKKNPSGQRIYARHDIETIVEIQNLLYNERYTISGARQMLARQPGLAPPETVFIETLPQALADLKKHVSELLALLERTPML